MITNALREQEQVSQLKNVERLIDANRLSDAANMLNTLYKQTPTDPRLFLLGTLLAEAANNSEGMLKAALKAVELAPGWPVASIRLADVYSTLGQFNLAIKAAEKAILVATQDNCLNTEHLTRATKIAIKCQQFQHAAMWAEQACSLDPENRQLKLLMADTLADNNNFDLAIEIYTNLLESNPKNELVLLPRMLAYMNSAKTSLAIADVDQLLSIHPDNETYLYYDTVLKGQTPRTQPSSVVRNLFNAAAINFDKHLVSNLEYKLPQNIASLILGWHPDKRFDLLDLGCGTGLLGACLGRIDGFIVGVDLSSKMIEKAAQHGVYSRFNQVNVLDALQATPENHYDIITALDVLIYVGDLSTVIPNAHRILTPGGRFIFSCEAAPKEVKTYALQTTQRFVHQQDHVNKLLKAAEYSHVQFEAITLRLEAGEPVQGFVVVAQK